ncbi:AmmeMemoRadiSam system protein B [Candidatus Amarolinea aalborgensis]|uniref:AmmeMemoRadiSam system protein B n=1 Tax=Candidatus Amarolinea aalborgensis TaxID=2249329 RepID=UPI003BFA06BF
MMNEMKIRPPAVAGLFYAASAAGLRSQVQQLLDQAQVSPLDHVRALIAPHAGYRYSGPIAANAFKTLPPLADSTTTVLLLGPAHHFPVAGVAVSAFDAFGTPLGAVQVDVQRRAQVLAHGPPFAIFEPAHEDEHCLEVELPFLQLVLPTAGIVPLLFGHVDPNIVAAPLINLLRQADDVLLIVSSDLSHYYPYAQAVALDRALLDALLSGDGPGVQRRQACGLLPILTLMEIARQLGWQPHLLDYRNSGDTAGDHRKVVGYAAVAYTG